MTIAERAATAKTVVFIYAGHPNDVEIAKYSALAFARLGFDFETLNLAEPDAAGQLNVLLTTRIGDVFCFVSPNYAAAKILVGGQLLHRATGVPLVFYLMDHPVYFFDLQIPQFEGTIVFLPGQDLVDFVDSYYPDTLAVDSREMSAPPFPLREPRFEDFIERRNVILAPMNLAIWGHTMDGVWELIQQLPADRRKGVERLVEAAREECFTPLHAIAGRLGLADHVSGWQVGDLKLALDFIKVWRRDRMVRELIELPILVSSSYVPADLLRKYPQKFTSLSIAETLPLYQKYRFVLNASPLMTYALHDRVMNALFGNSVAITDPNNWTAEVMTDEKDVLIYDYAGQNAAKLSRYLDDPAAAYALTENAYDLRVRKNAFETTSFQNLIDTVDRRRRANGL